MLAFAVSRPALAHANSGYCVANRSLPGIAHAAISLCT